MRSGCRLRARREIRFPYAGTLVASAPVGDVRSGRSAPSTRPLPSAARSGRLPSHVRRAALAGAHRALAERRNEVEQLLVLETGKPLVDCRVEVDRTLLTLLTAAEEVARLHGETVPLDLLPSGEGLVGFWVRKPIGVVVGIAGFNYPLLLAAHKIAPALAAGCPVIVKPAPQTPLATLWLVHVVREALAAAGGPRAAVQLVTGGVEVGAALTTDRRVGAVSFTGSAAVGHQIARDAAPDQGAARARLQRRPRRGRGRRPRRGRRRGGARRLLRLGAGLHQRAAGHRRRGGARRASSSALAARMGEVVVGDPRDAATRVSALIDPRSTERVARLGRAGAGAGGAAGARRRRTVDGVLEPTVLLDVPDGAAAWDEEVFGPVVVVRSVPDLDAAVRRGQRLALRAARERLHRPRWTPPSTAIDRHRGRRGRRQRGARFPLRRHAVRRGQGLRRRAARGRGSRSRS